MALPPEIARSVPYVVAQQIGELMVRIEKLERRVHFQGQSLKRLVNENRLLSARLARQTRPSPERTPPPAPRPSTPGRSRDDSCARRRSGLHRFPPGAPAVRTTNELTGFLHPVAPSGR